LSKAWKLRYNNENLKSERLFNPKRIYYGI